MKSLEKDLKKHTHPGFISARLCGINSYNLGRPLAQLPHFFWSYFRAVEQLGAAIGSPVGPVDLVIPAGALGNTAAAFMAKETLGVEVVEVVRTTTFIKEKV